MTLKVGDPAPEFALPDQHGEDGPLSPTSGAGGGRVLLPPGRHAGLHHPGLLAAGRRQDLDAAAPSCSGSAPTSRPPRARFDTKYGLGFPLLSDPDHAVAEAYGAWGERSMYGKKYMGIIRSAFVIDEDGKVAETALQGQPQGHRAQGPARPCPADPGRATSPAPAAGASIIVTNLTIPQEAT